MKIDNVYRTVKLWRNLMAKCITGCHLWLTLPCHSYYYYLWIRLWFTRFVREPRLKLKGNTGTKIQERQVFLILLFVTFGFLILTTPAYIFFLYVMFVNFLATPRMFAGYYLFYNVAQKMQFTNYGINFFLYVMSGSKFRTDLIKLFECNAPPHTNSFSNSTKDISVITRKAWIWI